MSRIKRNDHGKYWQRCRAREPSYSTDGNKTLCNPLGEEFGISAKAKCACTL